MSVRDNIGTVKAFDLTSLLRHAFMSGRGLGDGDKISDDDAKAWMDYDPSDMNAFKRVSAAIDKARK